MGGFEAAPMSAFAVTASDLDKWGCPHCGYATASFHVSGGGSAVGNCGECGGGINAVADGMTDSKIGIGRRDKDGKSHTVYPKVVPHPRAGTPKHEKPDTRPEGEDTTAEFFSSRGVGMDWTPGCFVCGGGEGMRSNIAAFVGHKNAGERVVALFKQGARLDFRPSEPTWIQVKIGACEAHHPNLEALHNLTYEKGIITAATVQKAKEETPCP